MGVRGGQVVVDVFPEGIVEFCQQRGVQEAWYGRRFRGSPGGSMGLPYITSKGLSPRGFLGKAHILRRTTGKSLVQSRCTSRVNLVRVSLIILFILLPFLRTGDGMECEISRVSVRIVEVVGCPWM